MLSNNLGKFLITANQTTVCNDTDERPVCDTNAITHQSACKLFNSKAKLAYWGYCQRGCSSKGPICGINGVTYTNECAAWSDYILVDYRGRCRQIGLLNKQMGGKRCRLVKCTNLPSPYCHRIIPPGACCPICATAFRIIYSRKQIDRALYALRGQHKGLLTLHHILRELDALIEITECQLTGFLTIEVGIFVAIAPRLSAPNRMQIEACGREAEKLSNLITTQSHRITTNLILSGLTESYLLEDNSESTAAIHRTHQLISLIILVFTLQRIYMTDII